MSIDKLLADIQRIVNEEVSAKALTPIASGLANQVRVRTRLGKGVDNSGNLVKLKPLSEKYKEFRKRMAARLHSLSSPNRSHLTATGQLLDSIKGKAKNRLIEIYIEDTRTRELSGRTPTIGNNQISEFVEEAGRQYFRAANFEIKEVEKTIRKNIEARLRKL